MKGVDMAKAFQTTADMTGRILKHLDKQKERDISRHAIMACFNDG